MKPFNLEEYLKNPDRKVVTRDGRKVRVICTDKKGDYPIVALVEYYDGTHENDYSFKKDGRFYSNGVADKDLFFTSKKCEGWVNVYRGTDTGTTSLGSVLYASREEAEEVGKPDDNYVATAKIEWEE